MARGWGNRQGSLSLRAPNTLTHSPRLATHQDPSATAFDGEWEETFNREGLRGAPREKERMVGIWRKHSGGDPSRERGSKEWRQSITSQTLPEQRPPTHPMCFLGCLMQTGELMVLAVTLWLPSAAVTCKALTALESCLGCLSSA